MELRDYQKELAARGLKILKKYNILYLALEMRVGKTPVSLEVARLIKAKKILFVTKKKAISGIIKFCDDIFINEFEICIINYESLHKLVITNFDLVICDESQTLGSFPKPNKRTKQLKEILSKNNCRLILLSGSPTPESYSQIYHQLWISNFSPFQQTTFYDWCRAGFVVVVQKRISGAYINDYTGASEFHIMPLVRPLMLTYTQKQANFKVAELNDEIDYIKPNKKINNLVEKLVDDRIHTFKDGYAIVCNTAAKLQQKIHQINSGTVITESLDLSKRYKIINQDKANHIRNKYFGKYKIAIFYLFQTEGQVLQRHFIGSTSCPEDFNSTSNKVVFISQFQSGSRGINIESADIIIFYNIHFSAELYQQARQRASEKNKTTKTRLIWLFTKGGIEEKIYKRVINKQSYTTTYFRKDYL